MATIAALCSAGVVALAPASSNAAITIGSNLAATPNAGHTFLGGQPTHAHGVLPISSTAPGGVVAPSGGVVVRWRIKVGFSASPVALRITRPGTSNTRTGAGTGPTVTPATFATSTYDVRLPIAPGDSLGIDCCEDVQLQAFVIGSATHRSWFPRLEDGEPARGSFASDHEMLVNADIEPDADNDGYGDETQDGCPTDSSTHGPCPPTGGDPPGTAQVALDLDAKRRQKAARLRVTASCEVTEEPCAVEFRGKAVARARGGKRAATAGEKKSFKLKPRLLVLLNGERLTQRLKFRDHRKSVRALKRLLKQRAYRKRTNAKIEISASDAAGNSAAETLKVKLKR